MQAWHDSMEKSMGEVFTGLQNAQETQTSLFLTVIKMSDTVVHAKAVAQFIDTNEDWSNKASAGNRHRSDLKKVSAIYCMATDKNKEKLLDVISEANISIKSIPGLLSAKNLVTIATLTKAKDKGLMRRATMPAILPAVQAVLGLDDDEFATLKAKGPSRQGADNTDKKVQVSEGLLTALVHSVLAVESTADAGTVKAALEIQKALPALFPEPELEKESEESEEKESEESEEKEAA